MSQTFQPDQLDGTPVSPASHVEYDALALYFGLGQSLMEGVARRKFVLSQGPIAPSRALMFETGKRAPVVGDARLALPPRVFEELTDLESRRQETPMTEASRALLPALGATEALLGANFGRRGLRFEQLDAGSEVFANLCRGLESIAASASGAGLPVSRMLLSWIHGHADRGMSAADYARRLFALERDLGAVLARVAPGAPLLLCLSQTTVRHQQLGGDGVALGQLRAARRSGGRILLACPEYMLERSDGTHLTARAYGLLGAYHGRAMAETLAGRPWVPLHMVAARRAGTVVTVAFAGGEGPLVTGIHDPQAGRVAMGVRALRNLGFGWRQSEGPLARITEVAITGPREVTLRLNLAPPETARCTVTLGLFRTTPGAEGFCQGDPRRAHGCATNLRTESPVTDAFGHPLHDWACTQRQPVAEDDPAENDPAG